MSDFELLQQKVAAMIQRLEMLEQGAQARLACGVDDLTAQRAAEDLGFTAQLVVLLEKKDRHALSQRLKGDGWSGARIARALEVCERTIERWNH